MRKKIINIEEDKGKYMVPVHEFWKAALLGDFSYYHPPSSMALNLFDIRTPNAIEHFLRPMTLSYLMLDGKHKSKEGFVASDSVISEMQEWGFSQLSTEAALRRLNNKKLIETSQRVTFDEDDAGLYGEMPASFRVSTIGAYHLKRWITEFSYLDAMSYDTPVLDESVRDSIKSKIESFGIEDRLERAATFRSYLTKIWNGSKLRPNYFDWPALLPLGEDSFMRVERAIERTKAALAATRASNRK